MFDLTRCAGPEGGRSGFETTIDIRISDPSQFVLTHAGILLVCDLPSMSLGTAAARSGTSAEVVFFGDRTLGFASSGLTLTREVFRGTIPLRDFDSDEPAGDAVTVIDVTFERGERVGLRREENGQRTTMRGWRLEPSGTITFPTEPVTTVDVSACFAFDGKEQVKEH